MGNQTQRLLARMASSYSIAILFAVCAVAIVNGRNRCSFSCPGYNPVCASNGRTYRNPCSLIRAQCYNRSIKFRHMGKCRSRCDKTCSPRYSPVCGSNEVTYHNMCHLDKAKCYNPRISLSYYGPCIDDECRPYRRRGQACP